MKYAKQEIDGITIYNQLPHPYKNYPNFPNESPELIEAEGFLELVEPTLNDGEKYGELYQNENTFTYKVINIQAEIIAKALEDEKNRYIQRTQDGVNAYAELSAEFRLAKLNGILSEEQQKGIERILVPVRNEVLAGQWISALQLLEEIGFTNIGESLYGRLHLLLTDYITLNYTS
jgi:hypothetical protein